MSSFRLHSGDSEFNTRVDALFSSLQTVAKELEPQVKRKHEDTEQGEAEDSREVEGVQEFRQPQGRPPQWRGRGGGRGRGGMGPRNNTPDFIKHPDKWTRYSIADTPVLSDAENKREGAKLLADLESRPERDKAGEGMEAADDDDAQPKIVFKKPSASDAETKISGPMELDEAEEELQDTEFGGAKKVVMPEYVVGKTKSKSKDKFGSHSKGSTDKETANKEVKLSYLMFEEED